MICGGLRTKGIFKKNTDTHPLLSIVTVVYNGEKHLEQTIQSVLNQTYNNIEYIIIDGSSSDKTLDIIKKYEDKIDLWQSEPDKGIYDAMNKGIDLSIGEYIYMLNSGDSLLENIINSIIPIMMIHKNEVLYGAVNKCKNNIFYDTIARNILDINTGMIPHQSIFIPKKYHELFGKYDLKYKIVADYDFISKLVINNVSFFYTNLIIANYDYTGISSIGNKLQWKETKEVMKKYGFYVKAKFNCRLYFLSIKILKKILFIREN